MKTFETINKIHLYIIFITKAKSDKMMYCQYWITFLDIIHNWDTSKVFMM